MIFVRVNQEKFSLRRLYWIFIIRVYDAVQKTTDKSEAKMKILGRLSRLLTGHKSTTGDEINFLY